MAILPRTSVIVLLAVLMPLAAFTLPVPPLTHAAGRSDAALAALDRAEHVANEILVQYAPGASAVDQAAARGRIGAQRAEVIVPAGPSAGSGGLELVRLPAGLGIAAAVRGIEASAAVAFAEPNWIYRHDATADDTLYANGSLWGMYGDTTTPVNTYGSQAGAAWAADKTDCGAVWVGVIDEGYMYAHADLAANAGTNPGEVAGNGVDDDGNGLKDDVYGWDFDGNNSSVFDGVGDDHGTHVAGTIGALGGNGLGVAGVCWHVKLINAKFLGSRGGTLANAVKAVDYFTDLKARHGLNLVATNNSWGGGGYSQALYDAIERANDAGILFVAAAGNGGSDGLGDNNDAVPSYPSNYTNANVIAVASITSTGARSNFSNYGATSVDLGAPGSGVYSTVPVKVGKGRNATIGSGYASYSGTSMATPHVTGSAALYAATHPGATAAEIKAAILNGATATTSLFGMCVTNGRLNVSGF